MNNDQFVYVTYIASTPEKVWEALTNTEITRKFWSGNAVTSDWKVGDPVEFHRDGKLILQGKVLKYEPPRRLSYTFHSMHEPLNGTEQPSRVLFELENLKDQVKLTVSHDNFQDGSKVFGAISNGWPHVLSSLKSYLESNRVLLAPWYDKEPAAKP